MKFTTAVTLAVCGVVATIAVSTRDGGVSSAKHSPKQLGSLRGLQGLTTFGGGGIQGSATLEANQYSAGLVAGQGAALMGGTAQTTTVAGGGTIVSNQGSANGSTTGVANGQTSVMAFVPVAPPSSPLPEPMATLWCNNDQDGSTIDVGCSAAFPLCNAAQFEDGDACNALPLEGSVSMSGVLSFSAIAGNGAFGGGLTAPNSIITNPPPSPGQFGFSPFFPAEPTTTTVASGPTGGFGLAAGAVSLSSGGFTGTYYNGNNVNNNNATAQMGPMGPIGGGVATGSLMFTSVGGASNVDGAASGNGSGTINNYANSGVMVAPVQGGSNNIYGGGGGYTGNNVDSGFAVTGSAVFGSPLTVNFPLGALVPEVPEAPDFEDFVPPSGPGGPE